MNKDLSQENDEEATKIEENCICCPHDHNALNDSNTPVQIFDATKDEVLKAHDKKYLSRQSISSEDSDEFYELPKQKQKSVSPYQIKGKPLFLNLTNLL